MRTARLILSLLAIPCLLPGEICPPAWGRQSGFDPRVITFGESRTEIKSTPIEQRPYRPLHVYGNSIRRRHSRSGSTGQR